jgi:hypothetical protein
MRNDTSKPSSVFNVRIRDWLSSIPSRIHWPKGKTYRALARPACALTACVNNRRSVITIDWGVLEGKP